MPVIKRDEWMKLDSKGKLLHHTQRTIDRLQASQSRYDRLRGSRKIAKPIPFFEHE
jgi:hypothetical protein